MNVVGTFGDKKRHVVAPDGWHVETSGPVKKDDLAYNISSKTWEPVDDIDLTMTIEEGSFYFLIRKDFHGNK